MPRRLALLLAALALSACSSGDSTSSDGDGPLAEAVDLAPPHDLTIIDGGPVVALPLDAGPRVEVALSGNAFVVFRPEGGSETVDDMNGTGLAGWSSPRSVISAWVYVTRPGDLGLSLVGAGASTELVRLSTLGAHFDVAFDREGQLDFGAVRVPKAGYLRIDLQGMTPPDPEYGTVSALSLRGPAAEGLVFANDPANYYWSRRGPSVHLGFSPKDVEYFYNEVTVPVGSDAIGSYFMVNGFSEGYAGIQVKSESERWILFSVWDPINGGQATLVRKGQNVVARRFGGEGTGGQSYLVFPWVAGNTYAFVTRGARVGNGDIHYATWFYPPESGKWLLMAEWSRPSANQHLEGLYSFVENFLSERGYEGRQAHFGNQWTRTGGAPWTECSSAFYDTDATGSARQRLDFDGGVAGDRFFLRNGGFFSNGAKPNVTLQRAASGVAPTLDPDTLP